MDFKLYSLLKNYADRISAGFASVSKVDGEDGKVKFELIDGEGEVIIDVPTVKGDKGDRSTIEVGTVTSGSTASVTNSGDEHDAVFDFVLPKGDAPTITEVANTVYDYRVKFQGKTTVTTANLKGSAFFFGTEITSTDVAGVTAIIANSKIYDMYLNTETDNLYRRTDYNPVTETSVNNHWVKIGTLKGKEGLNAYRTWLTIEGNEGKTIQQWVEETSGSSYEIQKVWEKPSILDEDTELNVWYMYKTGKTLDGDKFIQKLYSANLTQSYAVGDKIAFKVVDGEQTLWIPATLTTAIGNAESGHIRFFQFTMNNPTLFTVSDYEEDLYDSEIVVSNQTEVASITGEGCPDGYTEIALDIQPLSSDAWKYISTGIDEELPSGRYAYWNGTSYVLLDVVFTATPPEGIKPAIMWDEEKGIAMMWGYKASDDTYNLSYPFFVKTELSDHVPAGVTDASNYCDLIQMGTWNQTIYVSASGSRADVSEVTLTTGANFSGVVMRTDFNEVIGTEDLHTTASTVKGAINELNDLMRTGTDAEFDTQVKNVIGAINELNGKMIDKSYALGDVNKVLQIKSKTIGEETVYEPQVTALKQTMTASETVSAGDILSANAVKTILDALMPIGMIVLGTKPTYGTWEAYNFGGYVCADTSLANGTTMIEHLPNITGAITGNGRNLLYGSGQATGVFAYVGASGKWHEQSGNSGGGNFDFNASRSSNVYGSSGNHYNVEVKGKNVTAWIRTA